MLFSVDSCGALGTIWPLIIGILSSVYPTVLHDPPEGEIRTIIATGLAAFLRAHNITWLFALCCVLVMCGIIAAVFCYKKEESISYLSIL